MKIIPAILENDLKKVKTALGKLKGIFETIQVDVANNTLVNNKTLLPLQLYTLIDDLSEFSLDFHLMTDPIDPALKEVSSLKEKIKIGDVFVHYKTLPDLFEYRKKTGLNIHLTIDPDDDIETAFEIYPPDKLEKILIMTVNPGFQGSVFIPFALERIPKIFSLGFRGEIYLDGGINAKTVEEITNYKEYITALCVGSFLIKSRSKKEVIEKKTFLENFFKTA